jgi:hypothetical protein
MAAERIDRSQWEPYFDRLTRSLVGKTAEIEVASLDLGDQIDAEWVPLIGITYDPKDDLIEVALEALDHLIPSPKEVYVDMAVGDVLVAVEIIDADGARQIVKMRDPLALPAPQSAQSRQQPAK